MIRHSMRSFYLLLLALLVLQSSAAASEVTGGKFLRALFIGNSSMFAHDMPEMIARLAYEAGDRFFFDIHAHLQKRYGLSQHAVDDRLKRKIFERQWDVVVLQEKDQVIRRGQAYTVKKAYPPIRRLRADILSANPKTILAFYMTMARRSDYKKQAAKQRSSRLAHSKGMQENINAVYTEIAKYFHGLIVPVGMAWKAMHDLESELSLYQGDLLPNRQGSYLAACIFYAALYQKSPWGVKYYGGLKEKRALYLQQLAERVVLSSGYRWDFSTQP